MARKDAKAQSIFINKKSREQNLLSGFFYVNEALNS
jgi:hypothetical protein